MIEVNVTGNFMDKQSMVVHLVKRVLEELVAERKHSCVVVFRFNGSHAIKFRMTQLANTCQKAPTRVSPGNAAPDDETKEP